MFQLELISTNNPCRHISPLCWPHCLFGKFVTLMAGSLTGPPLTVAASRLVTSWTASSGSQTLTVWSSVGRHDPLKQDQIYFCYDRIY